jgi:hypothetical protein
VETSPDTTRSGLVQSKAIGLRLLALAAAAALGIDAYVHLHDAGFYDSVRSSVLSQGDLFRAEAGMAIAVGAAVLVWPRRALAWAVAFLVAASAFGAVMLYRYVDVGSLGPLPNMYEPTWTTPYKLMSAYAEGIGAALTGLGLAAVALERMRSRRRPSPDHVGDMPNQPVGATTRHGALYS